MRSQNRSAADTAPSINFDQKQRINFSTRVLDVLQPDAAGFLDGMNRIGFINEVLRRIDETGRAWQSPHSEGDRRACPGL